MTSKEPEYRLMRFQGVDVQLYVYKVNLHAQPQPQPVDLLRITAPVYTPSHCELGFCGYLISDIKT